MPKIQRFEDLQSWQKARQLANAVYELTRHQSFAKDFQLRDQIRDAAGSVVTDSCAGVAGNYRTTERLHYLTSALSNWGNYVFS